MSEPLRYRIADNQVELERAIAAGEVDVPANATPAEEERILRQAVARPRDGSSSFVTGGDVSRFGRRTVPMTPSSQPAGATAAAPSYSGAAPAAGPARPAGPTVRVTRGQNTTEESVQRGAGAILDRQAQGAGSTARAMGSIAGTR